MFGIFFRIEPNIIKLIVIWIAKLKHLIKADGREGLWCILIF